MKLVVNGNDMEFDGRTLGELVDSLDIKRSSVISEVNGEIVYRDSFDSTELCNDYKIEIVRFVGGG